MILDQYYSCTKCLAVVRVMGDMESTRALIRDHPHWDANKRACPVDGCPGVMERVEDISKGDLLATAQTGVIRFFELNPAEFFRALCGFGLPEELGCEKEVIDALLLSASISAVGSKRSRSGRTVVQELHLDNGTILHFAASHEGAVVYKVTRGSTHEDNDRTEVQQDSEADGVQRDSDHHPGMGGCDGEGGAEGGDCGCSHGADDHRCACRAAKVPGCRADDDTGALREDGAEAEGAGERRIAPPDQGRPTEGAEAV